MTELKQISEKIGKHFNFQLIAPNAPLRMIVLDQCSSSQIGQTTLQVRGCSAEDAEYEFAQLAAMFFDRQPDGSTIAWRDQPKTWQEDGAHFMSMDVIVVPPRSE